MSHNRTHEQAEQEIQLLQSQLAQKDAKLRLYVAQRDQSTPPAVSHGRPEVKFHEEPRVVFESPLTPEDALRVLAMRAAKNKELQLEIRQLAFKVRAAFLCLDLLLKPLLREA